MIRARAVAAAGVVITTTITTDIDQAERSVLPGNRLGSERRDSLAGVPSRPPPRTPLLLAIASAWLRTALETQGDSSARH